MQNKSDERMKLFNIGLYLAAARRVRGTRRSLAIGTSTRLREDSAWMPGRLAAILLLVPSLSQFGVDTCGLSSLAST